MAYGTARLFGLYHFSLLIEYETLSFCQYGVQDGNKRFHMYIIYVERLVTNI